MEQILVAGISKNTENLQYCIWRTKLANKIVDRGYTRATVGDTCLEVKARVRECVTAVQVTKRADRFSVFRSECSRWWRAVVTLTGRQKCKKRLIIAHIFLTESTSFYISTKCVVRIHVYIFCVHFYKNGM